MLLVTPILNRELVTFLRRGRAFWYLLGYLVLIYFMTLASWVTWSTGGTVGDRAALSRSLFLKCSYAQIVVVGLFSLLFSARQISTERRQGTFDALMTTPLRAYEILIGKALASVGYLLLLAVAATPVYALSLLLGGVGWTEIGVTVYLTLLTGVTYAMIGVASSASPKLKAAQERSGGFGVIVLLNGGLAMGLGLFLGFVLSVPENLLQPITMYTFFVLSPPASFYALTSPLASAAGFPLGGAALLLGHTIAQAGVFLLFLWLGCRAIRKEAVAAVPHESARKTKKKREQARLGFLRVFPIPDFINPVTAKDLLLALPKRRIERFALGLLTVALFGVGVWLILGTRAEISAQGARVAYDVASLIVVGVVLLLVFLRASGVVASEAEANTHGLLAITRLSALKVMVGKLEAVIAGVAGSAALLYVGLALVFSFCHPAVAPHVLVMTLPLVVAMVASSAFYGAIGIWISAGARTVRAATNAAAILCFLAIFFAVPLTAAFAAAFAHFGLDAFFTTCLVAFFFPALLLFLPDEMLADSTGLARWFFFLAAIPLSLAIASLWLRAAAAIYAGRVRKDQERPATR